MLLSEVMETNIVLVKTFEDQEKVAELFKTYFADDYYCKWYSGIGY